MFNQDTLYVATFRSCLFVNILGDTYFFRMYSYIKYSYFQIISQCVLYAQELRGLILICFVFKHSLNLITEWLVTKWLTWKMFCYPPCDSMAIGVASKHITGIKRRTMAL